MWYQKSHRNSARCRRNRRKHERGEKTQIQRTNKVNVPSQWWLITIVNISFRRLIMTPLKSLSRTSTGNVSSFGGKS